MARKFIGSNNDSSSRRTWYYRAKFEVDAYTQPNAGSNEIKDLTFFERQYFGTIDNQDYPVTPKEENIVATVGGKRILNFVNEKHKDVIESIEKEKKLDDAMEDKIKALIDEYKGLFQA